MQWLLDANLSHRLVKALGDLPVAVRHVSRTGLTAPADDRDIWEWARIHNHVVITNDEDFYRFAGAWGFPPKLVMLRTGNQSTRYLAQLLRHHLRDIEMLIYSAESAVLELY